MFALTHIYCAKKINPKADNLFLYGAVFPDIPALGIVGWDLMKEKTPAFSNFVIAKAVLASFARGLTVHEDPYGIDRFVHGSKGYAFIKGKALHDELRNYFPDIIVPTAAHSFIEFAVETRMARRFPELLEEVIKIQSEANKVEGQISDVFSVFFHLNKEESLKAIQQYNRFLVYDISTKQKSVDFYVDLLKKLRSSNMPREVVEKLIDISLNQTKDYFPFLEGAIEKCKKRLYLILIGLLGIHLLLLINLRFTAWPEMLSYPYLFNNDFKLYVDFVHPYPPLLTLMLAGLFKAFGYNLWVLKLVTWLVILVNDVLIFKIVRKITGKDVFAVLAVGIYVLTQPFLEGNQLWFDLAIVPFVLAGFLLLTNRKYFWSGVALGLAVLIKQTAGLYLLLGAVFVVLKEKNIKSLFSLAVGPVVFGSLLFVELYLNNSFREFLNWTLIYPFAFWSKFPGYVELALTKAQLFILATLLFPLAIIIFQNSKRLLKDRLFLLLGSCLVVALVMVYPRFSFFHFQLALAFIAVTLGYAIGKFGFPAILYAAFGLLIVFAIILPAILRDWDIETRFWSRNDVAFAKEIENKTQGQSVYLLGQPSSLYVFGRLLPPKPWLDNYGWYFEIPGVQTDTLNKWSTNMPRFVVWRQPAEGNWYDLGVYQPQAVTAWITTYYNRTEELQPGVWLWQTK